MKSDISDTEEHTIVQPAETLVDVNQKIQDDPSTELHLKRLQLIDNVVENVNLVKETFVWLSTYEPSELDKARSILNDEITSKLGILTEANKQAGDINDPPLLVLRQLEPLADYFPVIYLSYGLFLLNQTRKRRERERSPLDILEELLSASDDSDSVQLTPVEKDEMVLHQKAYTHLSRAVTLLEAGNKMRVVALETLGQVCEKLNDLAGAFKAYREASSYGRNFSEKLNDLGSVIRQQARDRLLNYIDQLLVAGEFDKAEHLLNYGNPEHDHNDFRIRMADLAFLRGDLDAAFDHYKDLLE